jgi:hypothetical protein
LEYTLFNRRKRPTFKSTSKIKRVLFAPPGRYGYKIVVYRAEQLEPIKTPLLVMVDGFQSKTASTAVAKTLQASAKFSECQWTALAICDCKTPFRRTLGNLSHPNPIGQNVWRF